MDPKKLPAMTKTPGKNATSKDSPRPKGKGKKKGKPGSPCSVKLIDVHPFAARTDNPDPVAKKNEEALEKILHLLVNIRSDFMTPSNKEHLDKIQQILQNCIRRMMGVANKCKKVTFSEKQQKLIDNGEPLELVSYGARAAKKNPTPGTVKSDDGTSNSPKIADGSDKRPTDKTISLKNSPISSTSQKKDE